MHTAVFGGNQQATDRRGAAGIPVADTMCVHAFDRLAGRLVPGPGLIVVQVMAQIGADDDQRFRPTPQGIDHFGHGLGRRVTDNERHQCERTDCDLQEWQVDFEAVFGPVHGIAQVYARQIQCVDCRPVQRYIPQGRAKQFGAARGQALECDPVTGTEHKHAGVLITIRV